MPLGSETDGHDDPQGTVEPTRMVAESLLISRICRWPWKNFPDNSIRFWRIASGQIADWVWTCTFRTTDFVVRYASNRVSASLVVSALIIGSSIIMHADRGPMFMEFPCWGLSICYGWNYRALVTSILFSIGKLWEINKTLNFVKTSWQFQSQRIISFPAFFDI